MNELRLFKLRHLERTAELQAAQIRLHTAHAEYLSAAMDLEYLQAVCQRCEDAEALLDDPAVTIQDHVNN